jgi:hypothetical protein
VIDHLARPAANEVAAARRFAEVLGLQEPPPDGPDGDMYNVPLSGASSILFVTEPSVPYDHVAFGVSEADFSAIVDRVRQRAISFGNDPRRPGPRRRRWNRLEARDESISSVRAATCGSHHPRRA